MKVQVPVVFSGTVTVEIPDNLAARLNDGDRTELAKKFALSRVVATTDNPDAPDEDAFEEYAEEGGEATGEDWDTLSAEVGGFWHSDTTKCTQE